ncbi:hypothetical protein PAV_1c01520 [Paenibacillus alvei DSM 29]|nr:hypothetical protein PAV_1c01520 [Paenibacillus alvei DSM 29]
MIVLKGDEVKLKSGETAVVIDVWGVARLWCKLKTNDGKVIFVMAAESIDSIIRRYFEKRKGWGTK